MGGRGLLPGVIGGSGAGEGTCLKAEGKGLSPSPVAGGRPSKV